MQHEINILKGKEPIKQRPRREPIAFRGKCQEEIKDMLEKDVIEPCEGAWASPVVLVRKPDISVHFRVDYRKLNDITKKDSFPLPSIEESLGRLRGSLWFSTVDLASRYWQVEMSPADWDKTVFVTHDGLFSFKVMPFGLANAHATFERLMENVLAELHGSWP